MFLTNEQKDHLSELYFETITFITQNAARFGLFRSHVRDYENEYIYIYTYTHIHYGDGC